MNRRIHQTLTGEYYEVKAKGGRHKLPDDLKRTSTIIVHTTEANKARFLEVQKQSGMSESAFADLMLFVGLESFMNQETA